MNRDAIRWQDRITSSPDICHGRACIRGTRVMVSVLLDNLADGETVEELVSGFHVAPEDVAAALLYAAELAREQYVPLVPRVA